MGALEASWSALVSIVHDLLAVCGLTILLAFFLLAMARWYLMRR